MPMSLKPWIVSTCAAIVLATSVPQASALQRAASPGASAINARATSIPATLRRDYYEISSGEVGIGASGGAWQYFRGQKGDGAIYWSAKTGAHLVYGAYLDYFARHGEEAGLGYPASDPIPGRDDRCDSDAYAYQFFEKIAKVGAGRQLTASQMVLCQRSDDPRTGVYEGIQFN